MISIWRGVAPGLALPIAATVLRREAKEPSEGTLNKGGWKSRETILDGPEGCLRELAQIARAYLKPTANERIIGWAMVNRRGCHHPIHNHTGSRYTAVWCVDPGDAPGAPLEICQSKDGTRVHAVELEAGMLVAFPGATWHRVPVYDGERPRITIAIDIRRCQ